MHAHDKLMQICWKQITLAFQFPLRTHAVPVYTCCPLMFCLCLIIVFAKVLFMHHRIHKNATFQSEISSSSVDGCVGMLSVGLTPNENFWLNGSFSFIPKLFWVEQLLTHYFCSSVDEMVQFMLNIM